MSAAAAWVELSAALMVHEPSCRDDDRFTAETSEHDAALLQICTGCPVREQCRDYARAEHRYRLWGYFAGTVRRTEPRVRIRRSTSVSVPR